MISKRAIPNIPEPGELCYAPDWGYYVIEPPDDPNTLTTGGGIRKTDFHPTRVQAAEQYITGTRIQMIYGK